MGRWLETCEIPGFGLEVQTRVPAGRRAHPVYGSRPASAKIIGPPPSGAHVGLPSQARIPRWAIQSPSSQGGWMHPLGTRATLACWCLLAMIHPGPFAAASEPPWGWPVAQPEVLRGFAQPEQDWSSGHRGIDLAAGPGERVSAIGSGIVAFVGVIDGKPIVSIDHPGTGLRSTYEPVLAVVSPGQAVAAGAPIGRVASAGGHCTGRCLHLGVKRLQSSSPGRTWAYLDPMTLLRRWAILKPLHRRLPADAPE